MFALHSWISELDYVVEPEVECSVDDPNDAAFVRATTTIGGRDAVEEYVACKMYQLSVNFGFKSVVVGLTAVSKVETPLPLFVVGRVSVEHTERVLAEVETKAEKVLGSFGPREHNALVLVNIPNGGCVNCVFEQMGVSYAPRPLPEVSSKLALKKAKAGASRLSPSLLVTPLSKAKPAKKGSVLKMFRPKVPPGVRGTLVLELALAKPVGVSKKFHLMDVAAPPLMPSAAVPCAARVPAFNNLEGDSSLGSRAGPCLRRLRSTHVHRAPALLTEVLMGIFTDAIRPPASTDLPLDWLDDDLERNLHRVSFF
jgi:hypothetical protein